MKFRAYIQYTFNQAKEARKHDDKNIAGHTHEFTFQDILGMYVPTETGLRFEPPLFSARELIVPWLRKGNIPELIE